MAAEPFQLTPTSPKLSPTGNRVLRVCEYCGDLFDVTPAYADRRFCGRECYEADRAERITISCDVCGESFDVRPCESDQRFCSRDCYWTHRRGEKITLSCDFCRGSFDVHPSESDQRFCSRDCYYAHLRGEDPPEGDNCPHIDDYQDENGDCIQCDVERGAAEDVELKRQTSSDSLPLA